MTPSVSLTSISSGLYRTCTPLFPTGSIENWIVLTSISLYHVNLSWHPYDSPYLNSRLGSNQIRFRYSTCRSLCIQKWLRDSATYTLGEKLLDNIRVTDCRYRSIDSVRKETRHVNEDYRTWSNFSLLKIENILTVSYHIFLELY